MVAVGIIVIAYALRTARLGEAHFARVDRLGGSALIGKRALEMGYWAMEPLSRGAIVLGVSANTLTWLSLILGGSSGVALAFGRFGLAAIMAALASACDALDGYVARATNTASRAGALLDSSADRYVDFAFFTGLAVYYSHSTPRLLLTLAALAGAYMVSYASARVEALGLDAPRGVMRRHERVVYLIGGVTLTAALAHAPWASRWAELPVLAALCAIATIGNASAIHRLYMASRIVQGPAGEPARASEAGHPSHPHEPRSISAT